MKIIKIVLGILVVAIIIIATGAAYINFSGIPKYETVKVDYHITSTPEKVERGRKLASMLCVFCHTNQNTGMLTGERMLDAPAEFGKIYSQNITQDKTYGIGSWTDAEIMYLLRTGIKRDGQYAPPYMAKLGHMSDEDVEAIIAFLRSDNPMVAAAAVPDIACEPSFLTKFLSRVAFKPLPMPDKKIPMPDTTNAAEWGKYLVFGFECYACHSADFKTMNPLQPELSAGYMGGGNKPLDMEGNIMLTSNLTPDKETGIGNWMEDQFVKALKYGLVDGQPALRYPMMPFSQLTDNEAKAIFAYLQTIPPIKNKVERSGL